MFQIHQFQLTVYKRLSEKCISFNVFNKGIFYLYEEKIIICL